VRGENPALVSGTEAANRGEMGANMTNDPKGQSPAEQEIRAVHSRWIDAVNAGELARLLASMTDDAVLFGPGQAPFGREIFSATFSAAHQNMLFRCLSDLEEVVVAGEVAYTRSRDTLCATQRGDGKAMDFAGHRITIYRKQPDGRWLLARDAHTLAPVASPANQPEKS
jgi:uncharacterized protein (TIGR02246 family)